MTTSTQVTCPVCGSSFYLLGGRFPPHTFKGDPCPMSGREPQEWPRAEAVASLANSAITLPESALAGVGAMDTPPDKKRKPRSDKGRKRTRQAEAVVQVTAKPKTKRNPRGYIVAGDYESYPNLEAAKAALAVAMEAWEHHLEGAEGDPPTLIFGRVAKTTYIPAKTTPATVRVERP